MVVYILLPVTRCWSRRFALTPAACPERHHSQLRTMIQCGQVVMVVSGEAIRLGDSRTDSAKSPTSLRIRAGQIYGAEEVRACSRRGGQGGGVGWGCRGGYS